MSNTCNSEPDTRFSKNQKTKSNSESKRFEFTALDGSKINFESCEADNFSEESSTTSSATEKLSNENELSTPNENKLTSSDDETVKKETKSNFKYGNINLNKTKESFSSGSKLSERTISYNDITTIEKCADKVLSDTAITKAEQEIVSIKAEEIISKNKSYINEDSQEEPLSTFHRLMLANALCVEHPTADIGSIKNQVSEILKSSERSEVKLFFKKKPQRKEFDKNEKSIDEKLRELQNKKYTGVEKVKINLNKVTLDTVDFFCSEILKTDIKKIEEMQDLASYMFYKCIEEPAFLETYLKMIHILKKTFLCEEEKKLNREQSCFYGTILKMMINKIEEKHTWSMPSRVDRAGKSEGAYECERENLELLRIEKSRQAKGAVILCAKMYDSLIFGPKILLKEILFLMETVSAENVELISLFVETGSHRLFINHPKEFEEMCSWISKNNIFGPKVEIKVELALEKRSKMKTFYKPAKPEPTNSFAALMNEPEPEEEKLLDKVLDCLDDITSQVKGAYDEQDLYEIADSVKIKSKKFENDFFYENFFVSAICSKHANKMIDMFCLYLFTDCSNLFECLKSVKSNIGQHNIDYPTSTRKYPELLLSLLGEKLISKSEFEKLKTPEILLNGKELISKWKNSGDKRLSIVATPEEISKIL